MYIYIYVVYIYINLHNYGVHHLQSLFEQLKKTTREAMHRFRQVEAKEASKVLKEAQAPRAPGKSYLRLARFDGGLNGGDFLPMEFVERSPKEINPSFFLYS